MMRPRWYRISVAAPCAVLCAAVVGCGTKQIEGLGFGSNDGGFIGPDGTLVSCSQGIDGPPGVHPTVASGRFSSESAPDFGGIVSAAEPPPAISGGTLLVSRDGRSAIAADADRDRVYVVDLPALGTPAPADIQGMAVRASIPLKLHDEPGRLVEDAAGRIHVILRNGGVLATIDPVVGQVTMRRSVCAAPRGLAYDAVSDRLFVACAGGELVTFTPTGATAERTVKLQDDLRDVVVDGTRLLVTRFRSAETLVLDTTGAMMEVIKPLAFRHPAVKEGATFAAAVAWKTVAMPGGGAMMIHQRGMGGKVTETQGGYGGGSPCGSIVHTAVTKMRSGEKPELGPAIPGFVLPVDVAVSADGKQVAMVAAGNGHPQFSARKLFVTNVDDVTKEWDQGCGMDDRHGPGTVPQCGVGNGNDGGLSSKEGTCPPGLVLCGMECIDPSIKCFASIDPTFVGPSAAFDGGASDGVVGADRDAAFVPGTGGIPGSCYVDLQGPAEPVAVSFAGPDRVVVQSREPAELWILSKGGALARIMLSQESRSDTGHMVFHANSGGGLACASCHPEGHEDGRVWDFDCEGKRRTQDLGGGISGTEPFHWNGDMGTFSMLMDTVFVGRMSGPSLDRDHTMASLSWINSIPAKRALRPSTDAQAQRGKLIFNNPAVGCATCHAGGALTNNASVDVGTSAPFQVPSLRGISARAPYMHDGCAPTLAARFGNTACDGGDAHGRTSQLTTAELADLVAYLESL